MLLLASRLANTSVMGLQTGSELAKITDAVIDPGTLQIVAYHVSGPLLGSQDLLLRVEDSREFSDIGFIVDSNDDFIEAHDVIKIEELLQLGFTLNHRQVTDEKRRKLGKIIDYTVDVGSFYVQQLTVKRPLFKSFNDTELLIHRSQIIEINDKSIVVHSQAMAPEHTRVTTPGSYVNPFRKSKTIESIDNSQE